MYISVDIEGVAGVVSQVQASSMGREYALARHLMTMEANAAIEGAIEAGATAIVVSDGHGDGQNLLPDVLHEDAKLVRGVPGPLIQLPGLDATFDALLIVGQHGSAGTQNAVLDHTWVGRTVSDIRIDGTSMNETCLNAVIADHFEVPTVLVSGDEATINQTKELFPMIKGVAVKRSLSRYSAESVHPTVACRMIKDGALQALQRLNEFSCSAAREQLTLEIDFLRTDMADVATAVPGVERTSARSVRFTASPEAVFGMQDLLLLRLNFSEF